ncbi:hypothetical protein BC941DRAFT_455450 [Chlamydoabsidia padenii]|nr:hypothetical protein BC941DRAFT_455450 [Chlamydoabsidia padenii]
MSTKVVSVSPVNNTTGGLAGTSLTSQMDLAAQNDQLWSIISKQRTVIKKLELDLENMTKDRDALLQLKRQPSSPSPTPPQEPVPPPRSPFRQHQHYHSHDGSATITINGLVTTPTPTATTSTMRHRSSSSTPSGTESPTTITSPIHAILDKDAQLFAKYQQATKKQPGSSTSTISNTPPYPHNVRRALSQPHLMVTASTSEQNSFFSNIVIKVVDINIQQNVKNNPVVTFVISVCNIKNNNIINNSSRSNSPTTTTSSISMDKDGKKDEGGNDNDGGSDEELWRIKKVYSDFVTLDTLLRSQIQTLVNSKNCIVKIGKLPERSQFTTHGSNAKMDQKKLIEKYLARAIRLPVPEKTDLVQFLSSDVFEQGNQPIPSHHRMKACQKEGYLSLHGKRPGVWHSYYFMLHGSTLDYYDSRSNSDTSIHPGEPNNTNNNSILLRVESQDHTSSTDSRPDHLRQRSSLDAIFFSNHHHHEQDTTLQQPHTSQSTISGNVIIKSSNASSSSEGDIKKPKSRSRSNRRTFWPKKIFSGGHGNSSNHNDTTGVFRGFLSRHSSDDAAHSTKQLALASHHQIHPFNVSAYQDNRTTDLPTSPVFGVPLEEAVRISKISATYELPAIVYRCIEFLENKNAIFEEGLYRLSGSAVKIKSLRNEFDEKGDVNLLESEEHQDCDIHAVSGLLKLWLRELPSNVLTEKLLKEFLPIIDREDCINELGRLISMLPLANYTLLRALTAHLLRVVQNADTNKMTLRNMGIVFSPTLGIPTGIFNLFLCEFDYIFWTMEEQPAVLSSSSIPATPTPTNHHNDNNNRFTTKSDSIKNGISGNSDEDGSLNIYDTIHPTQIELLPSSGKTATSPRPRHWYQEGRSNRNSVQYTDGAPECMVGIERQCHEGVVDQVDNDDLYLLGLQETHEAEDNSDNDEDEDDDDDDDMGDFDDLSIHNIPRSMMENFKMTSGPVS